jgi:hypothetical protein
MSVAADLQPDQNPERCGDHVAVYEEVFEPLTDAFASRAIDHRLIKVAARSRCRRLPMSASAASLEEHDAEKPRSHLIRVDTGSRKGSRATNKLEWE